MSDVIVSPFSGGVGGLSDAHIQDGAPTAAAAGGGGAGERHGTDSSGKTNQYTSGCHGCPPGVCVNCGQLCRPLDENTKPHFFHAAPCHPARLPLEALGGYFRVSASIPDKPQMTYWEEPITAMKGTLKVEGKTDPLKVVSFCPVLDHTLSLKTLRSVKEVCHFTTL